MDQSSSNKRSLISPPPSQIDKRPRSTAASAHFATDPTNATPIVDDFSNPFYGTPSTPVLTQEENLINITDLEDDPASDHPFFTEFAITEAAKDLDLYLLLDDLADFSSLAEGSCYISKSGRTLFAAFWNIEEAKAAVDFESENLTRKIPWETISAEKDLYYKASFSIHLFAHCKTEPLEATISILSADKQRHPHNIPMTAFEKNIVIRKRKNTDNNHPFPEILVADIYTHSIEHFVNLTTADFYRRRRFGVLKLEASYCWTNDPNFVKLYISGLKNLQERSSLFGAINKAGFHPILVDIATYYRSNHAKGYGFSIIPSTELDGLLMAEIRINESRISLSKARLIKS